MACFNSKSQARQKDNKAVYVALGVDLSGRKDILITCSDNLTGMSEAIEAVYPKTEHQLCIV